MYHITRIFNMAKNKYYVNYKYVYSPTTKKAITITNVNKATTFNQFKYTTIIMQK